MNRIIVTILLMGCGATTKPAPTPRSAPTRTTIAFGSCLKQTQPQPIWKAILATKPDAFLMIGDNVYADTEDETEMLSAYAALGLDEGFAALRDAVPVYATWDDHDYGKNDAGREFPGKHMAKRVFLDFFRVPENDPRRTREGVYSRVELDAGDRRLQIVFLDTRWFRSALTDGPTKRARYLPSEDPEQDMLGPAQWQWLEETLKRPADLRLVVSSIQVVANEHGYEKWGTMPKQRARLLDLLGRTKGVIVLSGDRHQAEVSRMVLGQPYPLWDVTSSSLNLPLPGWAEPNIHRLGQRYSEANFGTVAIDWVNNRVDLAIRDVTGNAVREHRVPLDTLR